MAPFLVFSELILLITSLAPYFFGAIIIILIPFLTSVIFSALIVVPHFSYSSLDLSFFYCVITSWPLIFLSQNLSSLQFLYDSCSTSPTIFIHLTRILSGTQCNILLLPLENIFPLSPVTLLLLPFLIYFLFFVHFVECYFYFPLQKLSSTFFPCEPLIFLSLSFVDISITVALLYFSTSALLFSFSTCTSFLYLPFSLLFSLPIDLFVLFPLL